MFKDKPNAAEDQEDSAAVVAYLQCTRLICDGVQCPAMIARIPCYCKAASHIILSPRARIWPCRTGPSAGIRIRDLKVLGRFGSRLGPALKPG
jgi:hypothetical protein